jgi:hypothetical protein
VDQLRQAPGADPETLASLTAWEKNPATFTCSTDVARLLDVRLAALGHFLLGGMLVECWRFAYFNGQRTGGADTDAEPSAVAQFLSYDSRLAIHHVDGTHGTRHHAGAAAIAQRLVNAYDLSSHSL